MSAAWFGTYAETISRSPHAGELLDARHRLSAGRVSAAASRCKQLVRESLSEAAAAGELHLEPAGLTPDTAADLLIAAARGLQSSAAPPAACRRYLNTLVRVTVAGLASSPPRSGTAQLRPKRWLAAQVKTGCSGAGEVAAAEERGSCQRGEDSQAGEPGGGGPVGLGGGDGLDVVED